MIKGIKSSKAVKEFVHLYKRTHSEQLAEEKRASRKKWHAEHPDYNTSYHRAYARKNKLTLHRDGKRVVVQVRKRWRPEWCELCKEWSNRLDYHHWDDENPSLGLWLCTRCHRFAEAMDRQDRELLMDRYLFLKSRVEGALRTP